MAIGILCAYRVLLALGRRVGIDGDSAGSLVTLTVFSGLAGARLFYVVEHWAWYRADPASALKIWEGGLMFYGSAISGAAAVVAWCAARRRPLLTTLDLFAAVLPIGQAFGRVGCFMNGCCHGKVWDGPAAVSFPAGSVPWIDHVSAGLIPESAARSMPVVPVQLLEAAGCLAIAAALAALFKKAFSATGCDSPWRGIVAAGYLALYGTLRFWTETLRADERAHPFGGDFSISQTISLGSLALAAALFAAVVARVAAHRRRSRGGAQTREALP